MEEQQKKRQRAKKWKRELEPLWLYWESHNIFLSTLPSKNGGSHMGYLETYLQDAGDSHYFIQSFSHWREELQKHSQGLSLSTTTTRWRLQTLVHMERVKLSNTYSICAEYLVEVFKYPGTSNCILLDSDNGYGMTQMISLYGLVEPYSIARITTTQSGVVKDRKKKSTLKCYCMMCHH